MTTFSIESAFSTGSAFSVPGGGLPPGMFCWSSDFLTALKTTRWTFVGSPITNAGNLELPLVAASGEVAVQNNMPDITTPSWRLSRDRTSGVALPTVTNELLDVLNFTYGADVYDFGMRADNGVSQELAVIKNGSPVFQENDSDTAGQFDIETGDFTYSDFGGSVIKPGQKSTGLVGTTYFDGRWKRGDLNNPVTTPETLVSDVVSGPIVANSVQFEGTNFNPEFTDFDADFSISLDITISSVTEPNPRGPGFSVVVSIGGVIYVVTWAHSGDYDGLGYRNDSSMVKWGTNSTGGSWTFKIARTGSNLTLSTSGDDTNSVVIGSVTGDLEVYGISIENSGGGGGTPAGFTYSFTNFVFDKSGAELVDPKIFFKKDSIDKYIGADTSSNITALAQSLNSVDAVTYTAKSNEIVIQSPIGTDYCTELT